MGESGFWRVHATRAVHLLRRGAVEDRAGHRRRAVALVVLGEDAVMGGPAEVGLEDLANVHPARHAEQVQDDVDRRSVLQEGHVLLGDDARDHALVPVATGELVASAIFRFLATYTRTSSLTPGERSSPASRENVFVPMTLPPSPCGTFREVSRFLAPSP